LLYRWFSGLLQVNLVDCPLSSLVVFPDCSSADQAAACAIARVSWAANFRALLHRRVRSVEARCQASTPYSSMGFVPLRGHSAAAVVPERACTEVRHLTAPTIPSAVRLARLPESAAAEVCPVVSFAVRFALSLATRRCRANSRRIPLTPMGFSTSKIRLT
jgi:hypothetical protein